MLTLHDFAHCCENLAARGFTVRKAEYCDETFGSWVIEFSSKAIRPHRLTWDGRDCWLILEVERPEAERTGRISFEELRQMSYEDGVAAYVRGQSDEWTRKWTGKVEAEQSLDHALEQLGFKPA
jgi:hypothetical protein